MKKPSNSLSQLILFLALCGLAFGFQSCNETQNYYEEIKVFENKLFDLSEVADNELFIIHLESIQQVINAEKSISKTEIKLLNRMYNSFLNDSLANPSDFNSYLNRKRMLILAWVSPTDSSTSFSWLRLPKNWDKEKEYPLYVHLHGLWDVAAKPISYMSFPFIEKPIATSAFEDGYSLLPWGRGNQWYHGISKIDIWESISELEKIVKISPQKKYLSGHSMGGYGTWHIAQESEKTWAAIGIYSGALWYNEAKYVKPKYAEKLKNIPTYFVWGNKETSFKKENIKAHNLLEKAGNKNLKINVFNGGHDYNEIDVENMYNWMRNFKKE